MSNEERGSIFPIGIGIMTISVLLSFVLVELIGVQYQTLQNKQLSDVLALKVATDLNHDGIVPVRMLDYAPGLEDLVRAASNHLKIRPREVSVISSDGKTMTASVCTSWLSITGLTLGAFGNICATSKARAIS
jgi:hypothetical protein